MVQVEDKSQYHSQPKINKLKLSTDYKVCANDGCVQLMQRFFSDFHQIANHHDQG